MTTWTVIRKPKWGKERILVFARVQLLLCCLFVPLDLSFWLWTLDGQTLSAWNANLLMFCQYCGVQGIGITACVAAVMYRYSSTLEMSAGDIVGFGAALLCAFASMATCHATAIMTRVGP